MGRTTLSPWIGGLWEFSFMKCWQAEVHLMWLGPLKIPTKIQRIICSKLFWKKPFVFLVSLSVKAASILKGFLNKNPVDRLGCNSDAGFTEIMTHQFFKSIEWELLEQKQIPPPYRPRLENDRDLANFPPEFTDEPVQLTPDDQSVIGKIDQTEFDGFDTSIHCSCQPRTKFS